MRGLAWVECGAFVMMETALSHFPSCNLCVLLPLWIGLNGPLRPSIGKSNGQAHFLPSASRPAFFRSSGLMTILS